MSQYQVNARGGLGIWFTDGTYANWNLLDQNGNVINDDPDQGIWDNRRFALDAYAGKQISVIFITIDGNTPAGSWQLYMQSVVYVGADGTVYPLFTQETTAAVGSAWGTSGVSNRTFQVQLSTGAGQYPNVTTYYHADHLGTTRLLTGWEGWPMWSGTFLPFGQEWNPEITVNHYKFTGKERDSESGLDNFGARYDSSQYGRFMTPDPGNAGADPSNPQSWNMYSYVLNNPLINIDPTGLYCVDSGGNVLVSDKNTPTYNTQGDCENNGDRWIIVNR